MEPAKNVTENDDDGSKAKLVAKLWIAGLAAMYGGCDKGELGLSQQQKKLPFVHPFPGHSELSSSLTSSADAAKHQLADIDEAVRLIRERTLKRSDEDSAAFSAAAASLEELSTVMLGLCRLVADNAKQLVVSADKAEDELMKTEEDGNGEEEEDGEELLAQKKRKLGDDEGEEEEEDEEVVTAAPVKRKKLKIDKLTQQPSKCCTDEEGKEVEGGTEEEEGQSLLEKKVPDFGLPTKQSMEQNGCCCLMRDDLPRSAGRSLPAKLAYLYERKCRGSSSDSKKTAKTARRRRSMTCDSGGAGSGSGNDGGGKRARVEESSPPPSAEAAAAGDGDVDKVHDKVLVHEEAEDKQKKEQQQLQQQQQQQSPQSSNTSPAYQACVKDPLNEQSLISSLPFDYDDDGEEEEEDEEEEEEEEMTLNLLLQLYGGQEENKKKKKKVAGEHQQPMHYLPVRWRHMMTGTSTGDGQGRPPLPPPLPPSSSRAVVDINHHHQQQQPMDERASLFSNSRRSIRTRCTVRSASIGGGQPLQHHQFGNGSAAAAAARRATASIKSIIYARDRRDPSQLPWWWQPVTPVIPPPALSQPLLRSLPAATIRASHAVNQQTGSIRSKICSSNRSTRSSLTNSEVLQHRLLSILSTRSCRGTIRVYELEQLVRAATATVTDADPTGPLSKQVVAAHFVALLRMNSTVQLRQKAAGGRRRPGLRLADFSSPSSTAVHKIYVSLVVNEKKEEKEKEAVVMKPPSDSLPLPPPPSTESAPFTA